ncbi:MAG: hypothetical protein V1790_19520, partial [Planctomycetota bacterium]
RCRRKIATFSWPVKCRRSFTLLISFSSVRDYTNQHGGKLHFRLKQHTRGRTLPIRRQVLRRISVARSPGR